MKTLNFLALFWLGQTELDVVSRATKGLRWYLNAWLQVTILLSAHTLVLGQDEIAVEAGPLIDQQPTDWIHLTQEAGGGSFQVMPLKLPGRPNISRPESSQRLPVVLKLYPDRRYEIAWKWIDRIDFFEQMVLDDAKQRLADKDFIGAFQSLSFLMRRYPDVPELEDLRQKFLFSSLSASYANNQLEQTLSTLEELRQTALNFRTESVAKAINTVVGAMLDRLEQRGDLIAANLLAARIKKQHGAIEVIQQREARLQRQSEQILKQAEQDYAEGRYREAHSKALQTIGSPAVAQRSYQLLKDLSRVHPLVRVGVTQRSVQLDASSLTSWPARRSGQLVQRPLLRFLQTGNEGGNYAFALGKHRLSDDYRQLILSADASASGSGQTARLSELLVGRADPQSDNYDPAWAAIMQSVEISGSNQLVVNLRHPHVLPHALMQWTFADQDSTFEATSGSYQRTSHDDQQSIFTLRPTASRSGQPVEIAEVFYQDSKQLLNDLVRGQIDMVDQIYPIDARQLSSHADIKLFNYALPSTHLLIPVSQNTFLRSEKFRRALLYATDRESILQGEILGSADARDGQVISGPFPLGQRDTNALAYAYNETVKPVDYNPQLAKLLVLIAQQELTKASGNQRQPPVLEKLVVGCPDFELARVAVQALIQQWAIVGVPAEMLVLPDGLAPKMVQQCDLIYVCTTMWEPATDIQRLLGGGAVTASDHPYVVQGLQRLCDSRNWREVRSSLLELHQIIAFHLPVLPLWQVTDRFAVRRNMQGVVDRPVSLYQDVQNWRLNYSGPSAIDEDL